MTLCGLWFSVLWVTAMLPWPELPFGTRSRSSDVPSVKVAEADADLLATAEYSTLAQPKESEEPPDLLKNGYAPMLPNFVSGGIEPVRDRSIPLITSAQGVAESPAIARPVSRGPPALG